MKTIDTFITILSFVLLITVLRMPTAAWALPTGEHDIMGQVQFDRQTEHILTIIQDSERAVVNWDEFSILSGELTRIVQPSEMSAILNRVVGSDMSQILGTLQSNGAVYLINPQGILIGPEGVVNTHTFVASTLDVHPEAFMASGALTFTGLSEEALKNEGTINVSKEVFLFAREVKNSGTVKAGETIGLGAGSEIMLLEAGTQRVMVSAGPGTLHNDGTLEAVNFELRASGGSVYPLAVNQEGIMSLPEMVEKGGRILLESPGGAVVVAGEIKVPGGEIHVLGQEVYLVGEALLDVSSVDGGGEILIGGDYQGKNPEIMNSLATYVGPMVELKAESLENGDAGHIIVWSDGDTAFYGYASTQALGETGDGGLVEVSGKNELFMYGMADRSSKNGKAGLLLLDPGTWTISATGAWVIGEWLKLGDVLVQATNLININHNLDNSPYQATSPWVPPVGPTPYDPTGLPEWLPGHYKEWYPHYYSSDGTSAQWKIEWSTKQKLTMKAHEIKIHPTVGTAIIKNTYNGGGTWEAVVMESTATASYVDAGISLRNVKILTQGGGVRLENLSGSEGKYYGIKLENSKIKTENDGKITLKGYSDYDSFWYDVDAIVMIDNTEVLTDDGDITITSADGTYYDVDRGIVISEQSLVKTTGSGDILIENETSTSASERGIEIDWSEIKAKGTGNIDIIGYTNKYRADCVVELDGHSYMGKYTKIEAESGNITIRANDGTSRVDTGIRIDDSKISAYGGNILIENDSSATLSAKDYGISIDDTEIKAEGSGTVDILGFTDAKYVDTVVRIRDTDISAEDGNITITSDDYYSWRVEKGIDIEDSNIETTNTGSILIETLSGATSSAEDRSIEIDDTDIICHASGNIDIIGYTNAWVADRVVDLCDVFIRAWNGDITIENNAHPDSDINVGIEIKNSDIRVLNNGALTIDGYASTGWYWWDSDAVDISENTFLGTKYGELSLFGEVKSNYESGPWVSHAIRLRDSIVETLFGNFHLEGTVDDVGIGVLLDDSDLISPMTGVNTLTGIGGNNRVHLKDTVNITGITDSGADYDRFYFLENSDTTVTGTLGGGSGRDEYHFHQNAELTLTNNGGPDGRLLGGIGNDKHYFADGVVINGDIGNDFESGNGNDQFYFEAGATVIVNADFSSGGGEDYFEFGEDSSVTFNGEILSGDDRDEFFFLEGADVVVQGPGNVLHSGKKKDKFYFHDDTTYIGDINSWKGDDEFYFLDNAVVLVDGTIYTGGGEDLFDVGDGANVTVTDTTVYLGSGDDDILFGDNSTFTGTIYSQGGEDEFLGGYNVTLYAKLFGGAGDDTFNFGNSFYLDGKIKGGNGDDDMDFGYGADVYGKVKGGDGNDDLTFGHGAFFRGILDAGSGHDDVIFGHGADFYGVLRLGAGHDDLTFGNGAYFIGMLDAGSGHDDVIFGHGADVYGLIRLGAGHDDLTFGHGAHLVGLLKAGSGHDDVTFGHGAEVHGDIRLGDGHDDLIFGNNAGVYGDLKGNKGNDEFTFGEGIYVSGMAYGGHGDDSFYVNPELAVQLDIDGGKGMDHLMDHSEPGDDIPSQWFITAWNEGHVPTGGMVTFTDVESLTGGPASDWFKFSLGTGLDGYLCGGKGTAIDILDLWLCEGVLAWIDFELPITEKFGGATNLGEGFGWINFIVYPSGINPEIQLLNASRMKPERDPREWKDIELGDGLLHSIGIQHHLLTNIWGQVNLNLEVDEGMARPLLVEPSEGSARATAVVPLVIKDNIIVVDADAEEKEGFSIWQWIVDIFNYVINGIVSLFWKLIGLFTE